MRDDERRGPADKNARPDALISLKFPQLIAGLGSFRVLEARTIGTASGSSQVRIRAVYRRGKRIQVKSEPLLWIKENSVVGRQFLEPATEQARLKL